MHPLVYYPGFEPHDVNWLKFALLYLEKLTPIIPESGDIYLTEDFRYLKQSTDLIDPLRPDHNEGANATVDALDQLEKILSHPDRYSHVFGTKDVVTSWTDPKEQNVTLFDEKYSADWANFCLRRSLCRNADHGILISPSLAALYMTILAHAISDARGLSPITEYRSLDEYCIFLRKTARREPPDLTVARGTLEMHLPANLGDISLEKVIRHRNKPGFHDKRAGFHTALDDFLSAVESGTDVQMFATSLGSIWGDLTDEALKIGAGVAGFGFGMWLVVSNPSLDELRAAAPVIGGAALSINSIVSIRNTWKKTKVKRYARRYLTDLKQLSPRRRA